MQNISMECSLPILTADVTFTSNDTPDIGRLSAENIHAQFLAWMKTLQSNPNADRTVRLASGANYALENGEIMHTRLDSEYHLKPGAQAGSSLAIAAAEKIHEEITVWVMGGAGGFGSVDPVYTLSLGKPETELKIPF